MKLGVCEVVDGGFGNKVFRFDFRIDGKQFNACSMICADSPHEMVVNLRETADMLEAIAIGKPLRSKLEREWWAFNYESQLAHIELCDLTLAEIYAFAGRMRKFLPGNKHKHVGTLAHMLVMRSGRKGMTLEKLEEIFIRKFGDIPDIWIDKQPTEGQ